MKTKTDIHSVTYLKTHAADLLEQVNREARPVIITQKGEPRAVVLDPDTYDRMRSAIGLLKLIAQGEEAIQSGNVIGEKTLFSNLEAKLRNRA